MSKKSRITTSDLQGLTSAIKDATIGIIDLAEDVNKRIVHPPYVPSTPIQHLITKISGFVHSCVKHTTKLVGNGLDKTFELTPELDTGLSFEKRETLLAISNGVVGDYLSKEKNPLAIPMQLRYKGETIALDTTSIKKAYPTINGKILLMVHGLCMNDFQWKRNGHDHGEMLAKELGLTPIYLYYNSGQHISTNGQDFSAVLEKVLLAWPVPVEELIIVAHSMGGLVGRSAIHYAKVAGKNWTNYLKKIVFLGTPHHGAPLERIGNYIDQTFEAIPYVKPFARLCKTRSAGITDLRFGNLLDKDWQYQDRFKSNLESKTHVALPENMQTYTLAASLGKEADSLSGNIIGDGLVQVESALGEHKHPDKTLNFTKENKWVAYNTNHLGLLSSIKVYRQLKTWLLK